MMNIDFNNVFEENIGQFGISAEAFKQKKAMIPQIHKQMTEKKAQMKWRALPYNQSELLEDIKNTAKRINEQFDAFVVLGIGGSALGSKALFSGTKHTFYNMLPKEKRGVRFFVEDNVDPDRLCALFDVIDVKKTMFHVITKSGNTVETMAQFTIVLDLLEKQCGGILDNIIVTTDQKTGIMRQICDANGFKCYVVPEGVGGRFSVLSPVGLLSAAVLNIDLEDLMEGARTADAACCKETLEENPAYMYALVHTLAMEMGVNISVMLPYADGLATLAEWYAQLWAESLGKCVDNDGNTVHAGQTPVRALGVTDQHSQIQLYNEGPFDKIITFIDVKEFHRTLEIPHPQTDMMDARYLQGQTINKLIASECSATKYAVTKNGKMNLSITLQTLDAKAMGELFFFLEMATAATGEMLNINTFNQPGVEEGKIATFALMGREGYEQKRRELQEQRKPKEEFLYTV